MIPPPRGIFSKMVAVLDASVPVLLYPTALMDEPFAGFTVTVIGVFRGRFEHCTTIGIGFGCWPEMMASGVTKMPEGLAETATAPMLATDRLAIWLDSGTMIG